MKQFFVQRRNSIWVKSLYSSATISLFLYIIIRGFSYDFPMSWSEEILLFIRIVFTGTFMISMAAIGCAGLYRAFEKMKRH
ncbi:MAG TPA: hypothetical protein VIZ28_18815 [Chitinophagaceae bacterium]